MSDESAEDWDDSDLDPDYEEESEIETVKPKKSHTKLSDSSRQPVTRQAKKNMIGSTSVEVQTLALGGRSLSPSKITALDLSESDSSDEESVKQTLPKVNVDKDSSYFTEISDIKPENTNYDFSEFLALQKSLSTAREIYERDAQNPKDTKPELSISELLSLEKQTVACEESDSETEEVEMKAIQITLKAPEKKQSSKLKKQTSIFEKQLLLIQKENQMFMHKVHILCWIAHGNYINSMLINKHKIFGTYLLKSHLPKEWVNLGPATIYYFKKLLGIFSKRFEVKDDTPASGKISFDHLDSLFFESENYIHGKKYSIKDMVVIFVAFLRHVNVIARLVICLQPVSLNPKKNNIVKEGSKKSSSASKVPDSAEINKSLLSNVKKSKSGSQSNVSEGTQSSKSIVIPPGTKDTQADCGVPTPSTSKKAQTQNISAKSRTVKEALVKLPPSRSKGSQSRKASSQTAVKESRANKSIAIPSTSKDAQRSQRKVVKEQDKSEKQAQSFSSKRSVKVLSSDSVDEENCGSEKKEINYWIEAYDEKLRKWISIDICSFKVACDPQEIYARCTKPAAYIIAWQNDGTLKDVTKRYVPSWHITSKTQIDRSWFDKSIENFVSKGSKYDYEEEIALQECESEMNAHIPTKFIDFKNHPLYVLKRHILKFEAIYPPDAMPVSYIKGEPIYSRFCVYELHTREKWMREAKVVKVNEKPYKVVKSHFKCKITGAEKTSELFGPWQVVDYIPPPVVDNVIPRNQFGNIEVYKPSMLPAGTVHLQVPGIVRIAKKMNIDCVPAIVGWEHRRTGSHPIIEGGVICKEFQDLIMDAWCAEADNSARRSKHKRRQKIFKLWYEMGKLQVIKARLKRKYNFGDPVKNEGNDYEPSKKERKTN